MALFVSYSLVLLAALLAVPVFIFCLEIVASLFAPLTHMWSTRDTGLRQSVAVLVPAHNESAGLRPTIENIKAQLVSGDRLLVVADNCTDDTAAVAAAAGAEVTIRNDQRKFGKGYALDFGVRQLELSPRDIVIVIDADCTAAPGAIDLLANACALSGRPVQALDLMEAPENSPMNYRVAEFAWRVKNWARPLGLSALGLPCQLMGTGMAFPWGVIRSAKLASGSIVEDLKLGLELAQAGTPPLFCPAAQVTSQFARSDAGTRAQRRRWEEGHVRMIVNTVPGFSYSAVRHGSVGLLALVLDLAVPPLSLLVFLLITLVLVSAAAFAFGAGLMALLLSSTLLGALVAGILVAWLRYGRDILPAASLWSIVTYAFSKFPLYRRILFRYHDQRWVRTDRNQP